MPELQVGICGTLAPDTPPHENPLPALRDEKVQGVLLQLNRNPRSKSEVFDEYSSVQKHIEQLLHLGALREKEGRIWVNFTLFDEEDQQIVGKVAAEQASELAEGLMQRRSELFDLFGQYRNPTVPPSQLAYAAVGCYFLDLAALHIAAERNQMAFQKEQPGGNHYTLWAEEFGSVCLKAVYWGCHSLKAGDFIFQTFGDHHHDTTRTTLPDILYRQPEADFPGGGIYTSLLFDQRLSLAEEIGCILAQAADGPVSTDQVQKATGISPRRCEKMVDMLSCMGYLEVDRDSVTGAVPYWGHRDIPLLDGVFDLCVPVFTDWCDENLQSMRQKLQPVRPLQNGVAFDEVFIQVWHHIFGLTNKELACRGLIHDTYHKGSNHTGYLPMVCESAAFEYFSDRFVQ